MDGGQIVFSHSTPSLTGWPTSTGIYVTKNTRQSLEDYLAAYPETESTSSISVRQSDLDDSSLTPLDGAEISRLDLFDTQTDHAFDNVNDLAWVHSMNWQPSGMENELMKIGDNSLEQLARMPGVQTKLVDFSATFASITDIQPIERFKTLNHIRLDNCPIENVRFDLQMPGITDAIIHDCPITDSDLKQIVAAMPNLAVLQLRGTRITNEGLKELVALKKLCNLDLSNTEVTDEGLRHLKDVPALRWLFLQESKVSEAASAAFAKEQDVDVDWDNERPKK